MESVELTASVRPSREECFEMFGLAVRQVMEDHYGHAHPAAA